MISVPVITIDGPSGVGKGALSQHLAKKLNFHLLDSGAIYRALALDCFNENCDFDNENQVTEFAKNLDLSFSIDEKTNDILVFLRKKNVTSTIRDEKIGVFASKVAVFLNVREALLDKQREFAKTPGLIADGRDMGTVVFPHANAKIFLDASIKERANRRFIQLQKKGINVNLSEILSELEQRDFRDRNRNISPLIAAKDAMIIDTTLLNIDEVFQQVISYIDSKI